MRKSLGFLMAGLVVLLFSTAGWSQSADPRENPADCDYTSTEETWTPDMATGILTKRVTHVVECDTPAAGQTSVTMTTEEWNGVSLVVTEVRQGVRTVAGGIYTTDSEIYDGSMNLLGKEVHTYDLGASDPDIWWQDWTNYVWDGAQYVLTGYISREYVGLQSLQGQATWLFYDTTFRQDPTIPSTVPILGTSSSAAVPPAFLKLDPSSMSEEEYALYQWSIQLMRVNVNSQREGVQWLQHYQPVFTTGLNPPNTYIASVLMGDRWNDEDPSEPFSGFFHRWVRWSNDVGGNLSVQFGWTSDRDLNVTSNDWWQARVQQAPSGAIQFIENAHRVGPTDQDHTDTYTKLNSGFQIVEQQYKQFDRLFFTDNFSELNTVVDGNQAPLRQVLWTVFWN